MPKRVIIIGAGLAGLVAAFAARDAGAEVLLIDRSAIGMGCNSALANGRFAGPSPAYRVDDYIGDTIRLGKMINHRPLVEDIAQKFTPRWLLCNHWEWNLKTVTIIFSSRPPTGMSPGGYR